ncbi:hypothetical protein [uncultured Flavobacterium sp.]|uniref:hypothetical protein n=1 Tax=uncultured Flavobacterium sp. TaxID=165435 RepID=UPI0025F50B39|nr:hypothetical protein [uncultured Flavobacterium sp.]
MKKITTLAVAFVMALGMKAQEVNFKPEYKANTTYTQTMVTSNKVGIVYEGTDEPMEQESTTTMTHTTQVGKAVNNELPFVTTMSMDASQPGAEMINGAKMIGKVKAGKPVFESIDAPNMPDQVKDMMKGMMEQGLSNVFLPAKKLKAGDSFVHETPMEIPLGAVSMKMKDVATYKLKKVEGRKAIFDVSHVITLQAKVEGQDMNGSGTGSGEMVYDMDHNYPVQNDAKVNMDMSFEAQGMKMTMKTTNDTKASTVITPGKK